MTPMSRTEIYRRLSLANNGYTWRENLTADERRAAEKAVAVGVVGKAQYNCRTYYYLSANPGHPGGAL